MVHKSILDPAGGHTVIPSRAAQTNPLAGKVRLWSHMLSFPCAVGLDRL